MIARLCLALLLAVGCAWGSDPAVPAVHASDYPAAAPAGGPAASPATQAGLSAAAAVTSSSRPWYADLGSIVTIGAVVAVGALAKLPLPPALLALLGPYGAMATLLLKFLQALLEPAAARAQRQLQENHAEAFRSIATVIQTTSNDAPIAALKARLDEHIPVEVRPYVDAFVAELEKRGVDHNITDTGPAVERKIA